MHTKFLADSISLVLQVMVFVTLTCLISSVSILASTQAMMKMSKSLIAIASLTSPHTVLKFSYERRRVQIYGRLRVLSANFSSFCTKSFNFIYPSGLIMIVFMFIALFFLVKNGHDICCS